MELKEIFEVLKKQGIEVVKDTKPSTFTRFKLVGPGFDSNKSWVWWNIKEAFNAGRLEPQKEQDDIKKFDDRIKPGTKVLLKGYGRRAWYSVESIHPSRKWIEVKGFLGNFKHRDILKFSNSR
jgi:hypothetical protein